MIQLTSSISILILLATACSSQTHQHDNVILNADEFLLSDSSYTVNNLQFHIPAGWLAMDHPDTTRKMFLDPKDSSMMLVNLPMPDLSSFGEPQSSTFRHHGIEFAQRVYQNSQMVFFLIEVLDGADSTNVYYAIPRNIVEDKAHLIEASLGSIRSSY